jgi:predicted transposase YdaD
MKQLKKVYLLHFIYEYEDGHEDTILLGVFSNKLKAEEAKNELIELLKTISLSKYTSIDEITIDRLNWEDGFVSMNLS